LHDPYRFGFFVTQLRQFRSIPEFALKFGNVILLLTPPFFRILVAGSQKDGDGSG
jgi:hypothetical protein